MKKSLSIITTILMTSSVLFAQQSFNSQKKDFTSKNAFSQTEEDFNPEPLNAVLTVSGENLVLENQTILADSADQLAVLVTKGGTLTLRNCTIIKSGSPVMTGKMPERFNASEKDFNPDGKNRPKDFPADFPDDMDSEFDENRMTPPDGMIPPDKPDGMEPPDGKNPPDRPDGMNPPDGKNPPDKNGFGPGNGNENYDFYGLNSAIVAAGEGSKIYIENCTVETDAEFANAVFSTNEAEIYINGITISTKQNSSRGLFATNNGKIAARGKVTITTEGAHCAGLATDRGGGFVTVGTEKEGDICTIATAGDGSPCIYSTGNISAYNLQGNAGKSQAVVIEGKNRVILKDCNLVGNDENYGGMMLYQSTSGDAEKGTAILKMENCTVQDKGGITMFMITNTDAKIHLKNCKFLNENGEAFLAYDSLVQCKNLNTEQRKWGTEGTNGGQVEVHCQNQSLIGKLLANEKDSFIRVIDDGNSDFIYLKKLKGKGKIKVE